MLSRDAASPWASSASPISSICYTAEKYTMMYILYTLYFYTVQVVRVFLNISSTLNMPSIFIGCGNLRVFRIMSSSISTKTCEYPQIPALYKNRGYSKYGRLYKSTYPYSIKTEGIKELCHKCPLENVLDKMSPNFGPQKKCPLDFVLGKNILWGKCPW
jgi:hypothetical protein